MESPYIKTQPLAIRSPASMPMYMFGGFGVRQLRGDMWQFVGLDGKHICYARAENVEYENSLGAEYLKSRSIKQ